MSPPPLIVVELSLSVASSESLSLEVFFSLSVCLLYRTPPCFFGVSFSLSLSLFSSFLSRSVACPQVSVFLGVESYILVYKFPLWKLGAF